MKEDFLSAGSVPKHYLDKQLQGLMLIEEYLNKGTAIAFRPGASIY